MQYPKWMYHETIAPQGRIIKTEEQEMELGPGWGDAPYPEAPPAKPKTELETALDMQAAKFQESLAALTTENKELTEDKVNRENHISVIESENKALEARVKELQTQPAPVVAE